MNRDFHRRLATVSRRCGGRDAQDPAASRRPMDARVPMEGRGEIIILSSNNYLGLSSHPEVIRAGREALDRYGAGTASVRFICGTFIIHRELERTIADFLRTESSLTYVSCWNANTGAIPLLADKGDAIVSDELNHASIIDGVRMSKCGPVGVPPLRHGRISGRSWPRNGNGSVRTEHSAAHRRGVQYGRRPGETAGYRRTRGAIPER